MKRNIQGYSLVELMVVVVLLAVLVTTMVGLFLTTLTSGGKANSLARIKEEGDYAMSTMERLIRSGSNADCTAADELTVTELSDAPSAPSSIYNRDGTRLRIRTNGSTGPTRLITSDNVIVTSLTFNCTEGTGFNQGDMVTIEFVMRAAGDLQTTETFNSRVVLRNTSS